MRTVVVCGGSGQVGTELARQVWPEGLRPIFPARNELDLADPASISRYFKELGTQVAAVINCAAYTAVDKAESEVGAAFLANAQGPAWLAEACRLQDIPLVHISTDYVFDGTGANYYSENDPVAPLGAYGASKLAGELAVTAANPRSVILRTAWVVSPFRANFVKTMLRLGSDRSELRVVDDQTGCPTSAADLARALIVIANRLATDSDCPTGRFHFVNAGEATWYELAHEIFRQGVLHGGASPLILGIPTREYPTPARRPTNSRLATNRIQSEFGIVPRDWHEAIGEIVAELLKPAI